MGTTGRRLEKELRLIARELIAKGQLPHAAPIRFWGGFGTGLPCALCDQPIQSEEIEHEVRPIEAAVQALRFHRVCHYAWQLECDTVKRGPEASRTVRTELALEAAVNGKGGTMRPNIDPIAHAWRRCNPHAPLPSALTRRAAPSGLALSLYSAHGRRSETSQDIQYGLFTVATLPRISPPMRE
jgi:hypothetical protein